MPKSKVKAAYQTAKKVVKSTNRRGSNGKFVKSSLKEQVEKYGAKIKEARDFAAKVGIDDNAYKVMRKSILRQSQRLRKSADAAERQLGEALKRMVTVDLPTKGTEAKRLREDYPKKKIDKLIEKGAAVDIRKKDKRGRSIRDYAAIRQDLDSLKKIYKELFDDSEQKRRRSTWKGRPGTKASEDLEVESEISRLLHNMSDQDRNGAIRYFRYNILHGGSKAINAKTKKELLEYLRTLVM